MPARADPEEQEESKAGGASGNLAAIEQEIAAQEAENTALINEEL